MMVDIEEDMLIEDMVKEDIEAEAEDIIVDTLVVMEEVIILKLHIQEGLMAVVRKQLVVMEEEEVIKEDKIHIHFLDGLVV